MHLMATRRLRGWVGIWSENMSDQEEQYKRKWNSQQQKTATNLLARGWTVTATGWNIVLLINLFHTNWVSWEKNLSKENLKGYLKTILTCPSCLVAWEFSVPGVRGGDYKSGWDKIKWTLSGACKVQSNSTWSDREQNNWTRAPPATIKVYWARNSPSLETFFSVVSR